MAKRFVLALLLTSAPLWVQGASDSLPKPTAQQRSHFLNSPEDVLKKKPCKGKKRVTLHCRDKDHYVVSNENHHEVFRPYIANVRGGYVGVGSDQNFTFIAWARSKFVWLMDYDPVVVWINHVHKGLILHAPTRKRYLALWKVKNRKKALKALARTYKGHPMQKRISWTYRNWRGWVHRHFHKKVLKWRKDRLKKGDKRPFSWLHSARSYAYIRMLFKTGRIRIMKGDLLLNKSLIGIGKASHKLKTPIRLVYLSNAEEFWHYTPQFRKNMRGLSMDKRSFILRTRFGKRYREGLGRWIYIVQSGLDYQTALASKKTRSVYSILKRRKKAARGVFTVGVSKKK